MAEEVVIKLIVDKKDADKNVKDVDNSIKDTEKSTKGLSNTLDKMSGGAVSAFNSLKSGVTSAINGFKSLRVAIIGTGIGALIIGIIAVKEAFTSSEEGQNKFAKLMGVIGSITGNLSDLLSNLGMKIIDVFENPKQAIKDFANLIKDNIVNRFKGILEYIPQMAKAVNYLFKGEFSKAGETATNAVAKVVLGTENLTQSIKDSAKALKEFGNEVAEDAKKAQAIADQRAKADKIDRQLIVDRAKANQQIADLRFKSEQRDKFSAKERIQFLTEASKISEDIANKEIYANSLRLKAQIEENKLSNSTKADLDEVANLKAKGIQLDTAKLNLQKRLQTSLTTFQNEEKSNLKKISDEKQKQLDEEEKLRIEKVEKEAKNEAERLEKIANIQDEFNQKREDEKAQTEIEKLELEKERQLKELDDLKANEEQKASIRSYYDSKIKDKTISNEKDTEKERIRLEENVANAKKRIGLRSLDLLAELAGKGSAIGKGIAVTQATISGIEGVQNAYTTAQKSPITALFPGYPLVQAGLAGAFSAVQIKKILSTNNSSGSSASSGASSTPSTPSFNLVEGTGSNQIAETISQDKAPIKTYVVASDVTTQAQLDRNKVEISSIG